MTIAMCYASPEGVILGADSTSSLMTHPGVFHFFNHSQKIFQIGLSSTVGVMTWGLGGVGLTSHRTHFAILSESIQKKKISRIEKIAEAWSNYFGQIYFNDDDIEKLWSSVAHLHAKLPFDPSATILLPDMRTLLEEGQYWGTVNGLSVRPQTS